MSPARPARFFASALVSLFVFLGSIAHAQEVPAPLREWMHNEQQLLSRELDTRVIRSISTHQTTAFDPESAQVFELPSYWVDADTMHVFTADAIEPSMRSLFTRERNGKLQVRLFVHPESAQFYEPLVRDAEPAEPFHATATASSRTLLVWQTGHEDQAFFAKVSLDREIGGVRRTVPASESSRSIGTANVLDSEHDLPSNFMTLPEVLSLHPRGWARGGMIIRTIPRAILNGQRRFVPLFSLYAQRNENDTPMLVDMINRSGQSPQDFVRTRLARPMARMWTELAVEHGITSEPHAQNVLVELDENGLPNGNFLMRDFGGFDIDFGMRDELGWERHGNLPHIGTFEHDYHLDEDVDRFNKLRTFFVGGFLHNLDVKIPQWQRAGRLGGARVGHEAFSAMMADEVGAVLSERTGLRIQTNGSIYAMGRAMHEARRHFVARERNPETRRVAAARRTQRPTGRGLLRPRANVRRVLDDVRAGRTTLRPARPRLR